MKIGNWLIILLIGFFASCQKGAGPGGKATIHVRLINGINNVGNIDVKVKYGASSFPGTNVTYDNTVMADYSGHADFEDLRRGDYYFYASYTDTSGSLIEGGAHVLINNKPYETHTVIDFGEADPF